MKLKVQIISISSRKSPKNSVMYHTASCLDMETGSNRLKNTFDYGFSQSDLEAYPDPVKLENQVVELGVNDIHPGFNSRIEMRGSILTAPKSVKA